MCNEYHPSIHSGYPPNEMLPNEMLPRLTRTGTDVETLTAIGLDL